MAVTLKRILYMLVAISMVLSNTVAPCKACTIEAKVVEDIETENELQENLEEIREQSNMDLLEEQMGGQHDDAGSNVTEQANIEQEDGEEDERLSEEEIIEPCSIEEASKGEELLEVYLEAGGRLDKDVEIDGDFYLSSGTLNLDGNNLRIKGNVYQTGGCLAIARGKLVVEGNYTITGNAVLSMLNDSDYMLVEGNYTHESNKSHNGRLCKGVLEIKGDYKERVSQEACKDNFYATGTHRVILSGIQQQVVSMESNKSRFNILELRNNSSEGIIFSQSVIAREFKSNNYNYTLPIGQEKGWVLTADQIYEGDLHLGTGILDLNGYKLIVRGSLYQYGGEIKINQGQLETQKDLTINSYSSFEMVNEKDRVSVAGNFSMASEINHEDKWKAGTLSVKGDFTQIKGSSKNICASDKHIILLNGDNMQHISVQSSNVRFNDLILTKPKDVGYTFSGVIKWNNLIEYKDESELSPIPPEIINPPTKMPRVEQLKVVQRTGGSISLKWEEPADKAYAVGYAIYRDGIRLDQTSVPNYEDTSVELGHPYKYQITIYDREGNESELSEVIVAEAILPTIIDVEGRMDCGTYVQSYEDINVLMRNEDNTKESYIKIEVLKDNNWETLSEVAEQVEQDNKVSCFKYKWNVTGLVSGVYTLKFTVYDARGYSSQILKEFKIQKKRPEQVIGVVAQPGEKKIILEWISGEQSSMKYKIYRSLKRDREFNVIANIQTAQAGRYIDREVILGTTYYYYITTTDDMGEESKPSEIVTSSSDGCADDSNEVNTGIENSDKENSNIDNSHTGVTEEQPNNITEAIKWTSLEIDKQLTVHSKKVITLKLSDYFLLQHILSAVEDDVTIMNIGVFKYIYPL